MTPSAPRWLERISPPNALVMRIAARAGANATTVIQGSIRTNTNSAIPKEITCPVIAGIENSGPRISATSSRRRFIVSPILGRALLGGLSMSPSNAFLCIRAAINSRK